MFFFLFSFVNQKEEIFFKDYAFPREGKGFNFPPTFPPNLQPYIASVSMLFVLEYRLSI